MPLRLDPDARRAVPHLADDAGGRIARRNNRFEQRIGTIRRACNKQTAGRLRVAKHLPLPFRRIVRKHDLRAVTLPVPSRGTSDEALLRKRGRFAEPGQRFRTDR